MSTELQLEIVGLTHRDKQPADLRYQVRCSDYSTWGVSCRSAQRMGHLGDFQTYSEAKIVAIQHPHTTRIRFYEDFNVSPSPDFLNGLHIINLTRRNPVERAYFDSSFL